MWEIMPLWDHQVVFHVSKGLGCEYTWRCWGFQVRISINFGFHSMLLRHSGEQGTPEELWNVAFRTSSIEGGLLDDCIFR